MDAAEIIKQIAESEGEKIQWRIAGLQATFYVFAGNREQLLKAIEACESAKIEQLWAVKNRPVLQTIQKEITRLLHNFSAASTTLIDHTRVHVRDLYKDKPFLAEYQNEMEKVFSKSEVSGFIKGLRNSILHTGLLPVVISLSFQKNEPKTSVAWNLKDLRSWNDWDGRGRAYLSSLDSSPRVHQTIASYGELVESFYLWLEKRFMEIHASAFREVDDLQDQLRRIQEA